MPEKILDFRSDTVTRPTPGMRAAMAGAEVGDDVFGEDPSVIALQERLADMLGKEAALYVPSGTMSNQLGVRVHCGPGDEFICEAGCHIYNYEQAGYAQLSGVAPRPVEGTGGVLRLERLTGLIRKDDEHLVRTRLVCLENTHNRGAGRIQPFETCEAICNWAHEHGLATHLDGARLFNAVVASGIEAKRWAAGFDTVSVCFSKGLGAPVGSALVGPKDLIRKAHRARKLFGGGMRQAGFIAAAALYALAHHVERLAEDHEHAQMLAGTVREAPGMELIGETVDTNIVIFRIAPELGTGAEFCERLRQKGLLALSLGPQEVRAVTHLDLDEADTRRACQILAQAAEEAPRSKVTAGKGVSYA
ncbi:MAG: aminotransferase class I/II-fold pyridoxal phosphate-dependent enzyme [Planctomycetota bacterium]|nr:MAG: aminotransferase class I/II-fold pyridoxal phosphate-dependent enzyme [Planctomycetota bacterium]